MARLVAVVLAAAEAVGGQDRGLPGALGAGAVGHVEVGVHDAGGAVRRADVGGDVQVPQRVPGGRVGRRAGGRLRGGGGDRRRPRSGERGEGGSGEGEGGGGTACRHRASRLVVSCGVTNEQDADRLRGGAADVLEDEVGQLVGLGHHRPVAGVEVARPEGRCRPCRGPSCSTSVTNASRVGPDDLHRHVGVQRPGCRSRREDVGAVEPEPVARRCVASSGPQWPSGSPAGLGPHPRRAGVRRQPPDELGQHRDVEQARRTRSARCWRSVAAAPARAATGRATWSSDGPLIEVNDAIRPAAGGRSPRRRPRPTAGPSPSRGRPGAPARRRAARRRAPRPGRRRAARCGSRPCPGYVGGAGAPHVVGHHVPARRAASARDQRVPDVLLVGVAVHQHHGGPARARRAVLAHREGRSPERDVRPRDGSTGM